VPQNIKIGDILLFVTSSVNGHLVRFFQGTNFSHVGIITEISETDGPIYIDSMMEGVYKRKLREDVINKIYDKIFVLPIDLQDNDEFNRIMKTKFIKVSTAYRLPEKITIEKWTEK
jgi:hypothetical protein